jgi:hypothetical protein
MCAVAERSSCIGIQKHLPWFFISGGFILPENLITHEPLAEFPFLVTRLLRGVRQYFLLLREQNVF